MAANRDLPVLNPLNIAKARSSLASLLIALGTLGPVLPGAWRDLLGHVDPDATLAWFDQVVAAILALVAGWNALIVAVGAAWLWWERRAPSYRLSLWAPLRGSSKGTDALVWAMFVAGVGGPTLALALALGSPASAEPVRTWGSGAGQSALRLERCDWGDCWEVRFLNRVSPGLALMRVALDRPGMVVGIEVLGRDGAMPDTMSVTPPLGYMAEPASITVEDGAEGVVVVSPLPVG